MRNLALGGVSFAAITAAAAAIPADRQTKDAPGAGPIDVKGLFKEHADAVEEQLGELESKTGELGERMTELEQKGARRGGREDAPQSIGQQVVAADEVKNFVGNVRGGMSAGLRLKAVITAATTDADGSAGALLVPFRDQPYIPPRRRLTIRQLLPTVRVTSGGSIQYPKLTGTTNNAATVAEGATKPQSDMKLALVTVPICTVAHWVLASRQILDDAPQLAGLIDNELLYELRYVEENQLLNGAGTGTDINGIYTQATPFTQAATGLTTMTAANKIDVIGAALLQNDLANEPATGIVLHPSDWTEMRLLKNSQGEYILGDPAANVDPVLFGRPVVPTPAQAAGTFLVGNFGAATLYDRWDATVLVSTEDSDNFRKNLVTVLAEERIGLAVKNAAAFTKGTFSTAIIDLTS